MICLASRLERLVCRTLCLEWCLLRRTICTSSSRCVCVCGGGGGASNQHQGQCVFNRVQGVGCGTLEICPCLHAPLPCRDRCAPSPPLASSPLPSSVASLSPPDGQQPSGAPSFVTPPPACPQPSGTGTSSSSPSCISACRPSQRQPLRHLYACTSSSCSSASPAALRRQSHAAEVAVKAAAAQPAAYPATWTHGRR